MKGFSKWGTFYNYISYQQELLEREEQPCLFFVSQLYVWLAFSGYHDDDVLCRQQEKPSKSKDLWRWKLLYLLFAVNLCRFKIIYEPIPALTKSLSMASIYLPPIARKKKVDGCPR